MATNTKPMANKQRAKAPRHTYKGAFLETIWSKLQDIKEELGLFTDMQALEHSIITAHDKICGSYKTILRKRAPRESVDPMASATARVEREKVEKEMKRKAQNEEAMLICEALEGNLIDHGNGYLSCKFNTYDLATPNYVSVGELEVPLDQLASHHVTGQYRTDLPSFNKNQADLKLKIQEVLETQGE